jgi:hypothetical protein
VNDWDAEDAAKYMNPYTENVTNIALRNARDENARQVAENGLRAARSGGLGGSRAAVADAMAAQGLERNIGDITTQNQFQAYQNAQQQFNADRGRMGQAAQGLAGLGTGRQAADISRLGALGAAGEAQQMNAQKKLDIAKMDWDKMQNWDWEQLQKASDIYRGQPGQSTYTPPVSMWNQMAGVGMGLAGLNKMGGG